MSPTVFRHKGYQFLFFSNEEARIHIHVMCADGEAKYWLEPVVALEASHGLPVKRLREIQEIIEEHQDEIKRAWRKHFKS